MITLCPVAAEQFDLVADLQVTPEQIKFSGTVREAFDAAEDSVDFHAIIRADTAVGFFKIDRLYPTRYPFARASELGLRAFLVDQRQQGQGIATRAVTALHNYLPTHYPHAPSIVLSVNMTNPAAIACYLKGGFHDTGETYLKGIAGPQHVMRMPLR